MPRTQPGARPSSPAPRPPAMTDHPMAVEYTISRLDEVRQVQADIKDALQANQFGDRDLFSIELALEEALVNAIKHGNQLDPCKRVFVRYEIVGDRFDIRIEDEGPG